jgi:hypothetical protein
MAAALFGQAQTNFVRHGRLLSTTRRYESMVAAPGVERQGSKLGGGYASSDDLFEAGAFEEPVGVNDVVGPDGRDALSGEDDPCDV